MNSIEKEWKKLLKKVITTGEWIVKDDGDNILECMDNHCFIRNIVDDVMITGQAFNLNLFLNLIGNGKFNIDGYPFTDEALQGYVLQLDDSKQIYNESFVYTYPERIYNAKEVTRENKIIALNQSNVIINRLRKHKESNRAVATLYLGALDQYEQHIPCLNWLQCLIRDNELSLHVMFRSNDLYGAFPSNMMFLMYLGLKITEELKAEYPVLHFKGIYYNSTSLHIYKGDYEQARKVVEGD